MKEGWEYKKFEDALEKVKYTKKLQTNEFLSEGRVPIISQEEDYISGFWNNPEDAFKVEKPIVIFGDHSRVIKYVDFDFVLGADGVKILRPIESLNAKFLYHYLKWYNVPSMGYSRHFKFLKEINMPIPPMNEQQQIVSELDLLSGVIEKQKAQLEELDKLAQSIFYDMFGDPVKNEKGWETEKFGKVYKLKSGEGLSAKQFVEGPYPVYGGNGISGYHNSFNLDGNYVIIGRVGVYCGNVRNVKGKFWLTDNAFQLFYDKGKQIPVFVTHLLSILDLHQYANHAAQPVISNITLKDVDISFPPLSLQQEYAAKVEAIEAMKAKVRLSLKETETLFNSRMDYYFN